MPVRPQPVRFRCSKCGWSHVWAPPSDVVIERPPVACRKCGGPLTKSPAGPLDLLTSMLTSIGKK